MKTLLLFLISLSAAAQTPTLPAPVGDFSKLPTYLVGLGGEYNRWASPAAGALITLAFRVGDTNIYSWSTIDTPIAPISAPSGPSPASVRTGMAYVLANSGSCFLFVLGDAGVATGSGSTTLGAYSGGGGVFCNLRAKSGGKLYLGPVIRAIKVSSSTVQPVAEFMVSWGF